MSFYTYCLDCQHYSYGWSEDESCATCGGNNVVEADTEEAIRHVRERIRDRPDPKLDALRAWQPSQPSL